MPRRNARFGLAKGRQMGDMIPTDTIIGSAEGALTLKERFRRTMFFQSVETPPNFEFGYWDYTLDLWHEQGLPEWVVDEKTAYDYFGIEDITWVEAHPHVMPLYEHTILEETESYRIYRNAVGVVAKEQKGAHRTIPHYIDFPIKDRASWEPFKEALAPDHPGRWEKFEASLERARTSTNPVGVNCGSMVGVARDLMGFERMATLPYEDPALFKEIVDTFGACAVGVIERVLPQIQVDFGHGWEDICFNGGPIIPPGVYREVIGPWYRRIADLLTLHGCCVYSTDTDGNIMPIIEIFLDNGLNTMFPAEVHAGSDPCLMRDRYGKRVRIWGGVDKMKLGDDKASIDRELERIRPYVEQGAFIPTVDHRVPANITLTNYLYYLDRKRALFNVGGTPKY